MKKFIGVILLAIVILAGCSGKTEKEPENWPFFSKSQKSSTFLSPG